jgi:hypothetical protein
MKQRAKLNNDPELNGKFKRSMLYYGGLYNRRILASGLIGVSIKGGKPPAGITWELRDQAAYRVVATKYEGLVPPDASTIMVASPLSEVQFDALLKEMGVK